MKKTILIVEDEQNLGEALLDFLNSKGYHCLLCRSCQEAKDTILKITPSIILMDIGLPDGSGLDLAREFRVQFKTCALLFLSALNDPEIRVKGLELGADDYITKPFDLRELVLRIERIEKLQELIAEVPKEIELGKLKIYFSKYELVDANEKTISLSQKECAILELLYKNKNHVLDRNTIIDIVWGKDQFPSHRTVDNYIVKFRKWYDTDTNTPISIENVRGVGYKLMIKE